MINPKVNQIQNGFQLDVLVSDEDPDGQDLNGDNVYDSNSADDDGDFGISGTFSTLTVGIDLVPYNRIGETQGNNDTIGAVQAAIAAGDKSSLLNDGDQNTHRRLDFNIGTDAFLDEYLDRNSLGDPANGQFGSLARDWAYVDGTIDDRGGLRDVDIYRIDIANPTGLFLDIDAQEILGSSLDAVLRVFDSSGNIITQDEFDPTGQSASSRGYDFEYFQAPALTVTGSGDGTADARVADPSLYIDLDPGTYYVSVQGAFSGGSFTTGDYELRILGDQRFDGSLEVVDPALMADSFHNTVDIDFDNIADNSFGGLDQFVIYLDFDGETGVDIPDVYNQTASPTGDLSAFDFDGDPAVFSPGERMAMQNIFRIVREDIAALNVNLTTDVSVYNAAAINNRFRVVVSETRPEDFTGNNSTQQFRILEGDTDTGIVFTNNVLNFSPGDSNPISGRIVAAPIETGNYVSNLIGLNSLLFPFSGSQPATGSIYPDAIVGLADQGLNSEFWKRGVSTLGTLEEPLEFELRAGYGWRNGFNGPTDSFLTDRDQQFNIGLAVPNSITGDGGWVTGSDNFLNAPPVITTLAQVGVEDTRGQIRRFERSGIIESNSWDNPGTEVHEGDFDLYSISPSQSTRLYVDVDEYATNLDLRVQLFRVTQNAQLPVNTLVEISLTYDPNTGELLRNGTPISQAEIDRARDDGINLSGNDAYIDFSDYSGGSGPYFINVTSAVGPDAASTDPTRQAGNYTVTLIKHAWQHTARRS